MRSAELTLAPFNLVIGPNGSGKTSLIQALLHLRTLAALPLRPGEDIAPSQAEGPRIAVEFDGAHEGWRAELTCVEGLQCDQLQVTQPGREVEEDAPAWAILRERLRSIRAFAFNHDAIAAVGRRDDHATLAADGGNLAGVLARWQVEAPREFAELGRRVALILPEYDELAVLARGEHACQIGLRLAETGEMISSEDLSQGTLYVLAMLALAHAPSPPAIICVEEIDRGIHPRLLRAVRDALYRLCYPPGDAATRTSQVIATTHSPYLLDLFRDHPEEVVIAGKHGAAASFSRLTERDDLREMLAEGSLGDMWYAGVLGGVPEER